MGKTRDPACSIAGRVAMNQNNGRERTYNQDYHNYLLWEMTGQSGFWGACCFVRPAKIYKVCLMLSSGCWESEVQVCTHLVSEWAWCLAQRWQLLSVCLFYRKGKIGLLGTLLKEHWPHYKLWDYHYFLKLIQNYFWILWRSYWNIF